METEDPRPLSHRIVGRRKPKPPEHTDRVLRRAAGIKERRVNPRVPAIDDGSEQDAAKNVTHATKMEA
jgi:hypothetical protein